MVEEEDDECDEAAEVGEELVEAAQDDEYDDDVVVGADEEPVEFCDDEDVKDSTKLHLLDFHLRNLHQNREQEKCICRRVTNYALLS